MGRAKLDQGPNFADVLHASIAQHYGTNAAFAAAARAGGAPVAEASVSRWLNGKSVPSYERLEQVAPFVLDAKGKPFPEDWLIGLVYPNRVRGGSRPVHLDAPVSLDMHELADEVNRLLERGTMPEATRRGFEALQDALLVPYRRYLRRRKAS